MSKSLLCTVLIAMSLSVDSETIVPDGSLNSSVSLSDKSYRIADGTKKGSNLFHSFARFDLDQGTTAEFVNSLGGDIDNIFSRVTGARDSIIDGKIKSGIPGANVFFLNPNGIVFGPKAAIDVSGSFYASTADEMRFADGSAFSMSDLTTPLTAAPLLKTAPPDAFGFVTSEAAPIKFKPFSYLHNTVGEGGTFGLIAGDLELVRAKVEAPNIQLNAMSTIKLHDHSSIASKEGNIAVVANTLTLTKSSKITTETFENDAAGQIDIDIIDEIALNDSRISAGAKGAGNGGTVTIDTHKLSIRSSHSAGTSRAFVNAETFGAGRGGDIDISAESIVIDGGSALSDDTVNKTGILAESFDDKDTTGGSGRAGSIKIKATDSIRLVNGGEITVETDSAGAGDIQITTGKLLRLDNKSKITTSVAGGQGDGGNIDLAATFVVLDGASELTANADAGRGGAIHVQIDNEGAFFRSGDSLVDASAGPAGIDGEVIIDSPDGNVVISTLPLSGAFLSVPSLYNAPCAGRSVDEISRFIISDRQGLPADPAGLQPVTAPDQKTSR